MEKSNIYPNMPQQPPQSLHQGGFATAPPPSYAESQSPPPPLQTVVLQPHTNAAFGPRSQMALCSNCGERNMTRIEHINGNKTHIAALIMCLIGLWCCCCIPYCVDSMKNTMHYCRKCNNFMGDYNR